MRLTGLLTTAALLGLAGMAGAQCFEGKYEATTAAENMTPIPTADAKDATETPILPLLQEAAKAEG